MERQKTALVVGMARSGIASAKLLAKNGYRVIINDLKRDISGLFEALGDIEFVNGLGAPPEAFLEETDLMVLSPVIPIFRPFVKSAIDMGIEVIGEIELGYRYCDRGSKFVCIGGTNGKTTTTALTGEIFKTAGRNTFVLGNIGIPICEHAEEVKAGDFVVAETASLQLESIVDFRANAAGLLNITEDHINRFGSMEAYIAAKVRMFENQTEEDFAILNLDDPIVRGMANKTKARVIYISLESEPEEGAFIRDGSIMWRFDGREVKVLPISELRIPGEHNVQNAMCAIALSLCMGIELEPLRKTLREFPGVEHRIEFVREKNGVQYINDSKGTNPDSTIKAVRAMGRPTILLLGVGEYDKFSDFVPLFKEFNGKVKAVIASGKTVPEILTAADATGFTNVVVCSDGLKEMVKLAESMAKPGDTVLLSPAAASWGMFDDFEHRGRVFKDIVKKL
ncbi:MAG: UDP-N-acetylmuramoyl-L-alanine--D-glutamate ligase [Clostridiales bacterium]|nr:UDP-N-acetylmuramoyl-L-alanine--D-glutamate ligase [Clostridiales bacterium]MDD7551501.1 UDP-N-acetylmuramoyl-L-alanine--D-glutamate ligase [Clostridia bacterium]MDY5753765.1 UDP-N-acetylmuramoyl-L-alanine--D-glutamate ligase [Eubacteriales bacterium]